MILKNRPLIIAYLAIALTCIVFNIFVLPPIQSPDEAAHIYRATQVAQGQLFSQKLSPVSAGGFIDPSVVKVANQFGYLPFQPTRRVDIAALDSAKQIKWSGERLYADFSNTAMYPPFLYLPAALAIKVGQLIDLRVIETIYLARLANAVVAFLMSLAALALIGSGAVFMFFILTLPMTMTLYGSCSQDGLAIASAALAVSLLSREFAMQRVTPIKIKVLIAMMIGIVISARIAYAPIAILLLFQTDRSELLDKRKQQFSVLLFLFVPIAISMALSYSTRIEFRANEGIVAREQLQLILGQPTLFFKVLSTTMVLFYDEVLRQIIGVLGWLDARFDDGVYQWIGLLGFLSLVIEATNPAKGLSPLQKIVTAMSFFACFLIIFLAMYLIWTKVGAALIEGVQGRYFLIPLIVLTLAIPTFSISEKWYTRLSVMLCVLTSSVIWFMPLLLLNRYY